jgi:hypothetical protein
MFVTIVGMWSISPPPPPAPPCGPLDVLDVLEPWFPVPPPPLQSLMQPDVVLMPVAADAVVSLVDIVDVPVLLPLVFSEGAESQAATANPNVDIPANSNRRRDWGKIRMPEGVLHDGHWSHLLIRRK